LSVDLPVEVRSRAAATAVSRRNNNDDNGDDDDDNNNMMHHEPNVEMIYQWNAAPKRYRSPCGKSHQESPICDAETI
jgi:hypothetical protein